MMVLAIVYCSVLVVVPIVIYAVRKIQVSKCKKRHEEMGKILIEMGLPPWDIMSLVYCELLADEAVKEAKRLINEPHPTTSIRKQ